MSAVKRRLTMTLVLVGAAVAQGSVLPVPLGLLARKADLVVIGVGAAPRNAKEMASLRVERSLKGIGGEVVSILGPADPGFLCDITELKSGERALFFLEKAKAGFRIMSFGRGKLRLEPDNSVTLWTDLAVSRELSSACNEGGCPFESVLAEIAPYLTQSGPTAFFMGREASERVLLRTAPTASVRCQAALGRPGFFDGCEATDGGTSNKSPSGDLLCITAVRECARRTGRSPAARASRAAARTGCR